MSGKRYLTFKKELDEIRENDLFRFFKPIEKHDGKYILFNNKRYLNLSSNDYLGLASDKKLHKCFFDKVNNDNVIDSFALGSSSSRLLTGDYTLYSELEEQLSIQFNDAIKKVSADSNRKDALVFNSGYHANIGIISAISGKDDLILSDSLNHASIIDGIRLSGSKCIIYDHCDYEQVEQILEKERDKYSRAIIISESVFSMNGDISDIKKMVDIKKKHDSLLYVDEAHAFGIFGPDGLGICGKENLINDVDILVATFGKAFASIGAFAIVDPIIKDYLINKMRTLIFTTSLPPVIVNWNLFNIKRMSSLKDEAVKLLEVAQKLREAFTGVGLKVIGNSQIVPVIIGKNKDTIRAAKNLQDRGFLLFPIREPTVPKNSSRIRISLTSNIDWDDVKDIPEILSEAITG